uniref:hypothetical protein n=1 Tax=Cyanobium sp. TaxID=2164130 RepID=UPI0040481AC4
MPLQPSLPRFHLGLAHVAQARRAIQTGIHRLHRLDAEAGAVREEHRELGHGG